MQSDKLVLHIAHCEVTFIKRTLEVYSLPRDIMRKSYFPTYFDLRPPEYLLVLKDT